MGMSDSYEIAIEEGATMIRVGRTLFEREFAMKKFLLGLMVMVVVAMPSFARANDVAHDTSDPLYLQGIEEILTQTSVSYWDHVLRAGQAVSYGLNNRMTIGANVHYQHDYSWHLPFSYKN